MQLSKTFRTLVLKRHNFAPNRIYMVRCSFSTNQVTNDVKETPSSDKSELQTEDQNKGGEIQKHKYRNIDTTVKHLQHRTDADLQVPDKEIIEAEMQELIKEARAKIKPVIKAMSDEEVKSICKSLDEMKKGGQMVVINKPA